jgi:hypothetical protein
MRTFFIFVRWLSEANCYFNTITWTPMAFGSELLVQYYHLDSECEGMKIGKLGNPPILLHDRICESDLNLEILKVDKQFILSRTYSLRKLCGLNDGKQSRVYKTALPIPSPLCPPWLLRCVICETEMTSLLPPLYR